MNPSFSLRARLRSFRYAARGLVTLLREQHNCRIHLLATLSVAGLGWVLELSAPQWVSLLLAIALVWVAEALNSALEYLADAVHPEQHPLVAKSKDVAAAGVLITAIIAALVGLLVFLPHIL